LRLLGLLLCASTKRLKSELFYELVVGYNPKERLPSQPNVAQSVISGNSEAQASDIHLDPAVYRSMDSLKEYLNKV
jgi:hypothetical protein